ncbi:MAG TPA: RHS repeat-associated core domain-containing protein [Candidatus Acidoferrales bacterium]|nr:RHS repeat-associated core domain-containing protein [Candidatus Acidoferrales bacterium]
MYYDGAYAPFGEPYAQSGTTDLNFTGMNQDTASNVYDFPAREYGIQGRWPSPDPAGLAAVNPMDPQTWNRYAYVRNSPLEMTDPLGLCGPKSRLGKAGWPCTSGGQSQDCNSDFCDDTMEFDLLDLLSASAATPIGFEDVLDLSVNCLVDGDCHPIQVVPIYASIDDVFLLPPTGTSPQTPQTPTAPNTPTKTPQQPTQQQVRCSRATYVASGLGATAALNGLGALLTGGVTPVSWYFEVIGGVETVGAGVMGIYAAYVCFQQ